MIELIIALGIGAALGGVTLFLGYTFGFKRGYDSGEKDASHTQEDRRENMEMLNKYLEKTSFDWNSLRNSVTNPKPGASE